MVGSKHAQPDKHKRILKVTDYNNNNIIGCAEKEVQVIWLLTSKDYYDFAYKGWHIRQNMLVKEVLTLVKQSAAMVTMLGHMESPNVDWSRGRDFGVVQESQYSQLMGGIVRLESQGQGENRQDLGPSPLLPS